MKKLGIVLLLILSIGLSRICFKGILGGGSIHNPFKTTLGSCSPIQDIYEVEYRNQIIAGEKKIVKKCIEGEDVTVCVVIEDRKSKLVCSPLNPKIRRHINGKAVVYMGQNIKVYNIEGMEEKRVTYRSLWKTLELIRDSKFEIEDKITDTLEAIPEIEERYEVAEVILGIANQNEKELEKIMHNKKIIEESRYEKATENAIEYLLGNI